MRVVCGTANTVDIFNAVMSALLFFWRHVVQEPAAVDYLEAEKYVEDVERDVLLSWHIDPRCHTKPLFCFGKGWIGLFSGFFAGFMCGSQPTQSFDALWE